MCGPIFSIPFHSCSRQSRYPVSLNRMDSCLKAGSLTTAPSLTQLPNSLNARFTLRLLTSFSWEAMDTSGTSKSNWSNTENGVESSLVEHFCHPRTPPKSPLKLCFLGNLRGYHRPDLLIQALGHLPKSLPLEIHLVGLIYRLWKTNWLRFQDFQSWVSSP